MPDVIAMTGPGRLTPTERVRVALAREDVSRLVSLRRVLTVRTCPPWMAHRREPSSGAPAAPGRAL